MIDSSKENRIGPNDCSSLTRTEGGAETVGTDFAKQPATPELPPLMRGGTMHRTVIDYPFFLSSSYPSIDLTELVQLVIRPTIRVDNF